MAVAVATAAPGQVAKAQVAPDRADAQRERAGRTQVDSGREDAGQTGKRRDDGKADRPGDSPSPAGKGTDGRQRRANRRKTANIPAAQPPPAPVDAGEEPSEGNPDPFRRLGAGSPFCRRAAVRGRSGCRISGSVAHVYPVSNYGLDVQVETGITKVESNLYAALQAVASFLWLGLVYALKGVLLLLEWAFSLDLLNESMRGIRGALERLHERVLGRPWFLAALSVAGVWAIWSGLVQRRTIQTLSGLAGTVALMVVALVLIANPAGTVGYASQLANEGSLGVLSAASSGSTSQGPTTFADASERLFDSLVVAPWCALQFGDVDWCLRGHHGLRPADLWLAFPADGEERGVLYALTKQGDADGTPGWFEDLREEAVKTFARAPGAAPPPLRGLAELGNAADHQAAFERAVEPSADRVRMQEKDGTFTRLALLGLIAVGLCGAIAVLLWLAVKLVLAGLLSLILLLLAPAMLLAAAFGESGRATFVGWLKRLAGALAAKLIYALLLAVVIVAATQLARLDIGWFGTWLLQIAFWWGILVKRQELTGFLSVGQDEERRGGGGLNALRWYANARAAKSVGQATAGAATALPRRAGRGVSSGHLARQEAGRAAVLGGAREALDQRAERSRRIELDQAHDILGERTGLQQEQRALSRALRGFDDERVVARAESRQPREPNGQERVLLAERDRVESRLASDEMRGADATVRESDRAAARNGQTTTDADRAAWREQRRRDIRDELPLDHDRQLRAAGIDPREYRSSPPQRQAELRQRVTETVEQDRRLLAGTPERSERTPTRREAAEAELAIPPDELRRRRGQERDAYEQERRTRRRRQHLYRR